LDVSVRELLHLVFDLGYVVSIRTCKTELYQSNSRHLEGF